MYEDNTPKRDYSNSTPGWVGGGILILIGILLLFRNLFGFGLENWWALFILIPAFSSLSRAYQIYRADGRLSMAARGPLMGGVVLAFISFAFLVGLNFGAWWPVLLIVGGIALLVNAVLPA